MRHVERKVRGRRQQRERGAVCIAARRSPRRASHASRASSSSSASAARVGACAEDGRGPEVVLQGGREAGGGQVLRQRGVDGAERGEGQAPVLPPEQRPRADAQLEAALGEACSRLEA